MLRIKIIFFGLLVFQSVFATETVLDQYIKIGLESNLVLGQDPKPFPVIPDEIIPFLRTEEQETKLRLIQPLFQPAIYFNHALKSNLVDIQDFQTTIYKRELIKEIKISYFNYLRAFYVIELFAETELLLKENQRVSEKLYSAQKVTRDAVYRSEAELSRIEQRQLEAGNNLDLARSYLNFLLNRLLTEENIQMQTVIEATDNNRKIKKSSYFPGLSAVADYGFQREKFQFSDQDDYWMASLVLKWNIFQGFTG